MDYEPKRRVIFAITVCDVRVRDGGDGVDVGEEIASEVDKGVGERSEEGWEER